MLYSVTSDKYRSYLKYMPTKQQIKEIQKIEQQASMYGTFFKYEKSLKCANQGLKKSLKKLGENHVLTASFYGLIGAYYTETKNYDIALPAIQKSAEILQKVEAPCLEKAKARDCLARIYRLNGEHQKSQQHYKNTLQYELQNLKGDEHFQTGISYINLSGLYFATNRIKQSVECCYKAIQIANKFLNGNLQIVEAAKNNIRQCISHF